ncbi:MAG: DNA-directed RNA polymerase subunit K [Candidatus Micrarchaeia archaeon]|jgi:DNA-directed RNA polymerase subunit K
MASQTLNSFELARLMGARALQLALGAPPLIKTAPEMAFLDVARQEFDKGVIPLAVYKD